MSRILFWGFIAVYLILWVHAWLVPDEPWETRMKATGSYWFFVAIIVGAGGSVTGYYLYKLVQLNREQKEQSQWMGDIAESLDRIANLKDGRTFSGQQHQATTPQHRIDQRK